MREMSASEASRSFSTVLDSAENGETIVVTRAGRRVAAITPAPQANGSALREVFERWRDNPALDDTLATRVGAARETASAELDTDPWRD
ncbi:MAG TPA: type II toxin-antitoxin system prevent-host-death family antitoxin [Jiangellaceae bacterium]|nr:type II toxin-antitoxin system prevent-host-death family antitoxin [Jiangellaceae bacterium]